MSARAAARAHLRAALDQMLPGDDPIIRAHVEAALLLLAAPQGEIYEPSPLDPKDPDDAVILRRQEVDDASWFPPRPR